MYKIAKENLSALFQMIAENQELYLPVEKAGQRIMLPGHRK